MVYVINMDGKPLMPTERCGHVRILLKKGLAKVVKRKPFTIKLLYKTEDAVQQVTLGIDPGRTNIGLSAVTDKGKELYSAHVTTRNREIPKLMKERKAFRTKHRQCGRRKVRQRRAKRHNTVCRQREMPRILPGCKVAVAMKWIRNKEARFCNRKRKDGWLTPTANQLLQTHINLVKKVMEILPINDVSVEVNRFAFMQMDNPTVKGVRFQEGPLMGYEGVNDRVAAIQDGKCLLCGKRIDHFHHIIPRHCGGSDTVNNIAGLCSGHHKLVHTDGRWKKKLAETHTGFKKKYAATGVLNQIIPYFIKEMVSMFSGNVFLTTGKDTALFREVYGIPKDHHHDAYCIACAGLEGLTETKRIDATYEIRQFRRHDRKVCHKENMKRRYMQDGKCVAVNRHKAFEQKEKSLEEYVDEGGKTGCLTVKPHKAEYKNPGRCLPGALVLYKGHVYTLLGTAGTQRMAGGGRRPSCCKFVTGEKVLFSQSAFVRRNTGLVYV